MFALFVHNIYINTMRCIPGMSPKDRHTSRSYKEGRLTGTNKAQKASQLTMRLSVEFEGLLPKKSYGYGNR